MKYLIINADDFGYSSIFNETILDLIKKNFITSTTVMVDYVTQDQQNQVNKLIELNKNKNISVGLHLDLKSTNFLEEIEKQYNRFISIFNFKPSHLDLHKWSYLEKSYPIIQKFCIEKNIPCRKSILNSIGEISTHFEAISTTYLEFDRIKEKIILLEENKSYEILFHPGTYDPNCKSSYNKQREIDVENIIQLNKILEKNNIKKITYNDREYLHNKN